MQYFNKGSRSKGSIHKSTPALIPTMILHQREKNKRNDGRIASRFVESKKIKRDKAKQINFQNKCFRAFVRLVPKKIL